MMDYGTYSTSYDSPYILQYLYGNGLRENNSDPGKHYLFLNGDALVNTQYGQDIIIIGRTEDI